jgi:hypothetical protein
MTTSARGPFRPSGRGNGSEAGGREEDGTVIAAKFYQPNTQLSICLVKMVRKQNGGSSAASIGCRRSVYNYYWALMGFRQARHTQAPAKQQVKLD